MAASDRRDNNYKPGVLERLALPALQAITDRILVMKSSLPQVRGGGSISLGQSPNPFNRKLLDEQSLELNQLLHHAYVVGATGSGKTYLILLMVMALIRLGVGFCVIDVHGDLTQMIVSHFATLMSNPAYRQVVIDRVCLFEPFDTQWALSFNCLDAIDERRSYLQVSDLLHHFKKEWKDVWGPRMEEIFRNTLLTLSLRGLTLSDAPRFLTDAQFRRATVAALTDPVLRAYWLERFEPLSDAMKVTAVQPVLNKITPLIDDFYLRHMFAQPRTQIDFRQAMDQSKWILINVSKGIAGNNAHLVGSLFVSRIRTAALSRADISEDSRRSFVLLVDEFQNFLNYDFEEILSEARKFRLGLVMAHQHLDQLERSMREAIFGNVAATFLFHLGHRDIREIASAFRDADQPLVRQALANLNNGEVVQRDGSGGFRVVKVHRLQKPTASASDIDQLRGLSHQRYYRRRSEVNAELVARTGAPNVISVTEGRRTPPSPLPEASFRVIERTELTQRQQTTDFPEGDL